MPLRVQPLTLMSDWDGLDRLVHVRSQAGDQTVNGRWNSIFCSECKETNLWPLEENQRVLSNMSGG